MTSSAVSIRTRRPIPGARTKKNQNAKLRSPDGRRDEQFIFKVKYMEEKNKKDNSPEKKESKPAKSSNKTLWWILGGCLIIIVISGLVIGGVAWWGYKKVKKEIKNNRPNFEKLQSELEKAQKQAERIEGQGMPPVSGQNFSEEPAAPETGEAGVLPANGERQMGYVKKVYAKGGKNYLGIDYIQWFTGDAAEKAMREDGECSPGGECLVLNDYYIRNVNPLIRTFETAPGVKIFMQTYDIENTGDIQWNREITLTQFKNIFTAKPSSHLKDVPYIVEIENKQITKITEQYVP